MTTPVVRPRQWTLLWSDEFNGPNGAKPDASKWAYDIGGNGFGNEELEYYTDRVENCHQQDGNLVITARQETFTGPDGVTRDFTSARLHTFGKFAQKYGRFESRLKVPEGQGVWPAFWMLGNNFPRTGWPRCGEIDVMENIGREPSTVHGTVHGPGYSGKAGITAPYELPDGAKFADDFHTFAVEWNPSNIKFFVDNDGYHTVTRADLPPGAPWVFEHPYAILLDLAVGGTWPGPPDESTVFPQQMLVDYVRVYGNTQQPPGSPSHLGRRPVHHPERSSTAHNGKHETA